MIFNNRKIKDITGIRSGKLVALRPVNPENRYCDENRKVTLWECQCDCGNKTTVRAERMSGKYKYKSCGCLIGSRHIRFVTKRGYKLPEDRALPNEFCGCIPMWYFNQTKRSSTKRRIEFNVTATYVNDVFLKQNKKCVLSGVDLVFGLTKFDNKNKTTASMDRIDSWRGYVEGNIQWLHKDANIFKGRKSDAKVIWECTKFKDIICAIADFNSK
jgi:hypothetical protein